jgi:NitT/TauT family transport system substrate-binding protein
MSNPASHARALRRTLASAVLASAALHVCAEVQEVRIAQQFGIGYLPLVVMKAQGLLEKHAERMGVAGIKVQWSRFAGGSNMNDALLSGNLDFATGGVPPFVTLWSRTGGSNQVKIASVMSQMPLYLNSIDPNVRSLKDLTEKDKIALPAVRTSNQAVILAMATTAQLGANQVERINRLTVSMSHPDATAALLNGNITAHFTAPPFQYQQLRNPRVHTILNSKDVLGPFSFTVAWTQLKFRQQNPRTFAAFTAAMDEAIEFIRTDKAGAAAIYINETKSNESVEDLVKLIDDPDVEFTTTPRGVQRYSEYMHELGLIKIKPDKWQDLFFDNVHARPGS